MDERTDRRGFLATAAAGTAAVGTAAGQEDGGPTTHEIEMRSDGTEYLFDPVGLHVEPGDTVRWINVSGAHSTTAYAEGNGGAGERRIPEGADPWNSETITEQGGEFEYTFEEEGTYDYFCIPHKSLGMVGRIVCGEPGGPAEGSENPDAGNIGSGEYPPSDVIVEQGILEYPYVPSEVGGGDGGTGGDGGGGLPVSVTQLGLGGILVVGLALTGKVLAKKYDNASAALMVSVIVAVLFMATVVFTLVSA